MLKSGKQLVKRGIGPYLLFLVLTVVKVPGNYYTIAKLLSDSFRIDIFTA